mgnify:CR=1 FL=1
MQRACHGTPIQATLTALYAIRIMSLALLKSRALAGMQAPEVIVEVHLANGLPAFSLVGLPDMEVREARDRVRAALQTSQFEFPQRRITVNLAPADLPLLRERALSDGRLRPSARLTVQQGFSTKMAEREYAAPPVWEQVQEATLRHLSEGLRLSARKPEACGLLLRVDLRN